MKLFVVLGMGRSGTSAITRGLQALGISLGGDLVPPQAGYNEKGFFEDTQIVQLNEELLSVLGSRWDALPLIHPSEFRECGHLEQFKFRAIVLLRSRLGSGGGMFAFKDPRTAQLLPFWKEVFDEIGIDVCYILASRHPTSVADSLQKSGTACEKSFYLWLDRVTASLLHTDNRNRLVVDYDLLIDDPALQLKRIAEAFSLPFDPHSPRVQEYTGEFLEKRLRHTRYEPDSLPFDPLATKDVTAIYDFLMQMARDRLAIYPHQLQKIVCEIQERLLDMTPLFQYMDRLEECASQMNELKKLRRNAESFEQWQRSWFKRAFHRWHPPGSEKNTPGFFRRLQHSMARHLNKGLNLPSIKNRPQEKVLERGDASVSFARRAKI